MLLLTKHKWASTSEVAEWVNVVKGGNAQGGCQEEYWICLWWWSHPCVKVPPWFLRHIRREESLRDGGCLNTCVPSLDYLCKGPQPPVVPGEGVSPLTRKCFQGWTHRRREGRALMIISAYSGRNCDRTGSETGTRRRPVTTPSPARALPGPRKRVT